jgi:hypothetical protein
MTALATVTNLPVAPRQSWRGVKLDDMDAAMRFSKAIAYSGFAPKSYYPNEPDPELRLKAATASVFAAVQLGAEVGLSPMASVQNIALINGRPGLFGPAMLAVVRHSGLLESIDEGVRGAGDTLEGYCTVTRVGEQARTFVFTMVQARRAGLTSKSGPWTQYPDRMVLARARTFALRDVFPDALLGLSQSAEELQDIPPLDLSRSPEPELEPKVRQFEVLVPGMDPEYFPQTSQGFDDCLKFMTDTVLDGNGGAGIVLLNLDLLDRLARAENGKRQADVIGLKDLARQDLDQKIDRETDTADAVPPSGAWSGETEGSH